MVSTSHTSSGDGEDALDVLWEDGERRYRRMWRDTGGERHEVLAAQPCSGHPTDGTLGRLAHEYALKDYLDRSWAVRPLELVREHAQTLLVLESTDARPLNQLVGPGAPVEAFLRVAIAVTNAVARMHQRGLVHKDIKATNILVDTTSGEARLTGFGIASRLPRERKALEPPELIEGTLSHMAPEQTGRMNRSIDSRSDLYSLGITFYQTLTGRLPFAATEAMEWVHCHVARRPESPKGVLEAIPSQLSAIIMKLLAKTPEERYQTAAGVERDLRRCLRDSETQGTIDEFPLGESDCPDRLLMPERLYGRDGQVATLLAAFDHVVAGGNPRLVLVSGPAGIGKSSLVNELHKVLVLPRGLFASGKFDQLRRDVPYATVAQALQNLIRQLLGKPEIELRTWRVQFRQALDPNGAVVTDLIPELAFIIGEQQSAPEVSPADAKARIQMALRQLIGVFAQAEHPLALFLDDLQWLDGATLELLENILVEPEQQHLLLIGAYRNNEVETAHPLRRTLLKVRESGAIVEEIMLGPLGHEDVSQWFADALHAQPERTLPLAQLVVEKTAGNPFFTHQFMQELVDDGQIAFDADHPGWRWHLGPIRDKGYTDNVVDLMVGKLSRLPFTTQEALKGLASLGNRADISILAIVQGASPERLHSDLWEALRLELIVRSDDVYRFVHDRVQEAAYSLIPEEQRGAAHLRIARLLNARIASDKREEAVFDIVGHFNRATVLLASQDERDEVAALNLLAAKRAMKAAAFASALNYLTVGEALVEMDGWRRHDLAFELSLRRAQCELLTRDVDSAEQRLKALSSRATNVIERAAVVCLQAEVYVALERPDEGLLAGAECLRQAGLDIPLRPTEPQARAAYDEICSMLDGVGIEELAELPFMTDPASRAILDVIASLHMCAAVADKPFEVLIICAAVRLILERGIHDAACHAFGQLGYLAAWRFGDFNAAFHFGQLGYELIERKGLRRFEGLMCLIFSTLVMPWSKHVTSCRSVIRRTFEVADSTHNRLLAVQNGNILLSNLLVAGDPLAEVEREAEVSLAFCRTAAFADYTDAVSTQAALIRSLRGCTRQFGSLDDERFDELRMESHLATEPHLAAIECWYWIRKLQARFFAGDYAAALEVSGRAQALLFESPGMLERAEHELFSALTHAALCDSPTTFEGRQHLEAIAAHHRQLETWARYCPENFENRALLVAAEIARIEGRDPDATRLYEQAIRSARDNGFINNEALALEIAARFYAVRGFDRIARTYMQAARHGYLQWGATGKVRQLDERYPYLRDDAPIDPTRTVETPVEQLDLETVLKVSQAVSAETDLKSLIAMVMRLALEHAGAERGLLILPHDEDYRIEAEASIQSNGVSVDVQQVSIAAGRLPESVFHYVIRTKESILLRDASVATAFSDDDYIRGKRARSVLCIPLLKQARLVGVIYLENNLTSGVFTSRRMALLELLASEAAISLENALLYRGLQERERESRLIVETIPGLVASLTPAGEVEFVNKQLIEYCGQGLEGMKQWGTNGTVHADDLPHVVDLFTRGITSGEPYDFDARIRRFDGVYRWFQVRGLPLRDMGGQVGRWYSLLSDIEDRKRAETELAALKDQLYKENLVLRDEVDRTSMFEEIVGTSPALKPVLARVAKVAPTDSTVLITGETGTGKELVARAIHRRSARASRAFVSVNCAAIPRELVASELFGHEKGAFTGATQRRLGRFELANGGTIFLDEVGDLPMETQVALLRVLQEREFERIGGAASVRVDVRVVTATNRDLQAAIEMGTFRSDLFYRLNVFPIAVPALRERVDDISLLVEYFIDRYGRKAGKTLRRVSQRTLDHLRAYPWPGNVRELQNVIERSVIVCDTDEFTIDESWLAAGSTGPRSGALSGTLAAHEKAIVEGALRASGGRVAGPSGAAARLNIARSTLESKIRILGIDKNRFRGRAPKQ
jgi:PAS domain S-box-containing protein